MSLITSRSNPAIVRLRSLHERKARQAQGVFLAEGIRIVTEALHTGADIEQLIVAPERLVSAVGQQTVAAAQQAGIPVLLTSAYVFESIAGKEHPQGLAAVIRQRYTPLAAVADRGGVWVALLEVQDPGNLGTILRTADATGAAGVILIGPCTDPGHPTALRASMGALFALSIVTTTFDALAAWQAATGFTIIGAAGSGHTHYRQATYTRPLILLMGSEQHGLSPAQQALCQQMVFLPMQGRSDSLNLAVATGVLLYEILHATGAP
ncbi:MAG: RNA methyltransferase [Anaerolineae bacterium]|jgi:TrmH family RNA methyltransferase|nr:RNA methyltransferase [Anaerolineae bacterium]